MSRMSEHIEEIKLVRMDMEGKGGKFHHNLNLLTAIILGIILPELAILVALAWLFGWLNITFQQTSNATTV